MSIPLLEITPTTQNQRVAGYEVPDEDDPRAYRMTDVTSDTDINELIWAAYRQIFSEHLILETYRQPFLESQLRNRAITVRDFVRGLGKSEVYRELVGETNSNYRLVDITFKRFLGRASYGKDEQISWSIVIATRGLNGFIDAIVDGEEYRQNFGDDVVPYQRRRFNERPFNLVNPRYGEYWRDRQTLQSISGRSYYQVGRTQNMPKQEAARQAISNTFFTMAGSLLPNERNYQRTVASVTSQVKNIELPDMTRSENSLQRAVKPKETALPYRYIPSANPTVE
ncbi:phycobilisome rod-core linker polypeptide [Gloeocapsopsis dulcis]|uniref:Phycobilisome rod-core linker polypeptide CpcG1 n=1 Tax=Gloeocapsopsis dulcis AAB1 = 1H9 TaxID=1433147 RepID=A0A6N8FSG7_9CHRO|nr:phycobilisome rod-core linker polypeptide [Gloeocapsopsis dulcis]MUL36080.1 phycobilisome rod-core linker polypeptide CpcG1 [Gloeocapsopsis dulcis AAB1 = 1H9]WNN91449.1 phycobilisome rod-core linker polypeptide [Gloeocapsopsis dulcis]